MWLLLGIFAWNALHACFAPVDAKLSVLPKLPLIDLFRMCLVFPAAEEALYRVVLFNEMLPWGYHYALWGTTICFTLSHHDVCLLFWNLFNIFHLSAVGKLVVTGLVLQQVVTHGFWAAVAVHGLLNLVGICVMLYRMRRVVAATQQAITLPPGSYITCTTSPKNACSEDAIGKHTYNVVTIDINKQLPAALTFTMQDVVDSVKKYDSWLQRTRQVPCMVG